MFPRAGAVRFTAIFFVFLFCVMGRVTPACAQTESFWTSASSGNWSDASNWGGPVPNAPGDIAHLLGVPDGPLEIRMDSLVALGQLDLFGQSSFTISDNLFGFINPGPDPALLRVVTLPRTHRITAPIGIGNDDQLMVDISAGSTLVFENSIIAGTGGVIKTNEGTLELAGDSSSWGGALTINEGTVSLRNAAGLGNAAGVTRINTGGTLRLIADVTVDNETFQLDGGTIAGQGSSFGSRFPTLNNPIELLSSGNINSFGHITINSSIVGPGDISYGQGISVLLGDSTYEGLTTIGPGRVNVWHANALGSPVHGTVVNEFGLLVLEQSVLEPITLRGGRVRLATAATSTGTITLESGTLQLPRDAFFTSPLVLANSGGDPVVVGDRTTFTGGVTGVGDLILSGTMSIEQQPLAHDGGLNASGGNSGDIITLNTVNSYTGTTVVSGGQLVVNHEDALGISTAPIQVQGGRLVLNTPISRVIDVGGELEVSDPAIELNQTILMRSGTIFGQGTFNGEIQIVDSPFSRPFLRGGTFNGVISGNAQVMRITPDDPVLLNAENTYRGITNMSSNSGSDFVEVNSSTALGDAEQGTVVRGGRLVINEVTNEPLVVTNRGRVDLNVQQPRLPRLSLTDVGNGPPASGLQTVSVNVPSQYDEFVDVVEGVFEINADTTVRSAVVREGGKIVVQGENMLHLLSDELVLQNGSVEGRLGGVSAIRKITNDGASIGELPGYGGEIVVESGRLNVESSPNLDNSTAIFRVTSSRNATLELGPYLSIFDDIFVKSDIYLENAHGADHTGALWFREDNVFLSGQLDLGDVGSTVRGLNTSGPITGGSLNVVDGATITGNSNTYTGVTEVRSGSLLLKGNGSLQSTSAIVLNENAGLSLNFSESSVEDRIGDEIPIIFRGGVLGTGGRSPISQTESFGEWNFVEGNSTVNASITEPPIGVVNRMNVASITRERGATAGIRIKEQSEIHLGQPLSLQGGILPWMIVRDELSPQFAVFGTVVNGQIRSQTAGDFVTDINAAADANNVYISTGNSVLASDKTINALTFGSHLNLDLDGNLLQVDSGGILLANGGDILNGTLLAGVNSNNELIIHGRGEIGADITDNDSGPVDVTVSPGAATFDVVFSGNNTYSGVTYVNRGKLLLTNETALPDNADLEITGGEVRIGYVATGPKHLGQVRIAGGGALTRQSGHVIFSFDQIILEDGELIPGQLVGTGQIVKQTVGKASIAADAQGSTFSGDVVIEEGRLEVGGLSGANFIVNGGKLVLPVGGNDITLAGGDLEFSELTGTIEVTAPSRLIGQDLKATLVGAGDLAFDGNPSFPGSSSPASDAITLVTEENPDFSGNVDIYTATVDVRKERSLGTGEIRIHPGGRLRLAPIQANFDNAKLDLPNNVHLQGGEVRGFDSVFRPQQLAGDLFVSGNSRISELDVAGTAYLADRSNLTVFGQGLTRFLGDLQIGGQTQLQYGITQIVSNAAGVDVGTVQLLGTISSDANVAVLDLIDRGLDEIVLDVSYQVATGQTLQVLKNGQPLNLVLDGVNNTLTGGGTLLNPVTFADGATISPGASPGTLSLGSSTTLNAGTVYEWEINDALGGAGQSVGWDLLQVADQLIIDATVQDPIVLRVIGLDGTDALGSVANFDPNQPFQWLIASADSLVGFDPALFQIDTTSFSNNNPLFSPDNLFLTASGGDLYLRHVPEPSALILLAMASVPLLFARRKKAIGS